MTELRALPVDHAEAQDSLLQVVDGVHEVGATDDGADVYVVMELVAGESLSAFIERTSPAWRVVARLLVDAARGLAAVHAAGVIHRDVKPDNIIVGSDGRARLGDSGLARASADIEATSITSTPAMPVGTPATSIAGTPAYMAPELLRVASMD